MEKLYKIFLAEDDDILGRTYQQLLETTLNVEVTRFLDGKQAMEAVGSIMYDVYILATRLPHVNAIAIGKKIRAIYPVAFIIFLSGAGSPEDKEVSFIEGKADYFIIKQAGHFQDLILELKAALYRIGVSDKSMPEVYKIGAYTLDPQKKELKCGTRLIPLPQQEYKILEYMAKHQGKVVTRKTLMKMVWGKDDRWTDHNLSVHVSRLKKKLKNCGGIEIFCKTGQGYRLFVYNKD